MRAALLAAGSPTSLVLLGVPDVVSRPAFHGLAGPGYGYLGGEMYTDNAGADAMAQASSLSAFAEEPPTPGSMDIDMGRPIPGWIYVGSGWARDMGSVLHPGIDIRAQVGTPVYAMQDGFVHVADSSPEGSGGRWVGIQHRRGWYSRMFHLSKVVVKAGQIVRKGQLVGYSGNSGTETSGPHLHVDLKLRKGWIPYVEQEVGRPKTGYFANVDGRVGVPAEPWVPVDEYRADTIDRDRKNNVPLYLDRLTHKGDREAAGFWGGVGPLAALFGGGIAVAGGIFLWYQLAHAGRRPWL
jgi:murein DD-endopeptidase MepM/ murein hydrolase activator NlpD